MRTDHSRIWLMTLLLGAGLSWPLPLGGALLAVAASFGLVISWEARMSQGELTPVPVAAAVPALPTDSVVTHHRAPAGSAATAPPG